MANSFSCIFHGLILNEILNETAFPLGPHFYTLTFSQVWSWELPSSRSTMVLLNHHSLSLVYNPSSVKVYASRLCLLLSPTISQAPSHSPIFTGHRYQVQSLSVLTSLCSIFADDWSNMLALTTPISSGANCVNITIIKYLIGPACCGFPVEVSLKYWFLLPSRISILPLVKLLNSFLTANVF